MGVFPTSAYLSFNEKIKFLSPVVFAILIDTAVCATYFLYRGWQVARRCQCPESLALHGCLMQCGILMSMAILPQRFLQACLSAFRMAMLRFSKQGVPLADAFIFS